MSKGASEVVATLKSIGSSENDPDECVCKNLVCPKGVGWGNMRYSIPEVGSGDWAIEILEVQIPIYVPTRGVGHNMDRHIKS